MKKSIVYLGLALVAFTNVTLASNSNSNENSVPAAKIVVVSKVGLTPLSTAVFKGDVESVKKFIKYGANVNEKSYGMSPLMIAARYNKVEIIKILLANGANSKERSERGYTAFKYAVISNANDAAVLLKRV